MTDEQLVVARAITVNTEYYEVFSREWDKTVSALT